MRALLLSINPEHVSNIMNESKKFEFRKTRCRLDVDRILIYCTQPVGKIVGEASIGLIIEDNPEKVWNVTKNNAGISKHFFDEYFDGKEKAVAYELKDVIRYTVPKTLSDLGVAHAPQSFSYVDY